MPSLSSRYDPAIGAIVHVAILPGGATASGQPGPVQAQAFPALVDTGASVTCVSATVAQALGLQSIGLRPMGSATGIVPMNTYLVDLGMPFGAQAYFLQSVQVAEFVPFPGAPYQILMGRDIICRGVLVISFDGHFTFSI